MGFRNTQGKLEKKNEIITSLVLPSKRSQTSRGILWGALGVGMVSLPKGATLVPVIEKNLKFEAEG